MRVTFILSFLCILSTSIAQDVSLQWANRFGNTNFDRGNSVRTDASGNVYTIGEFTGTVDFDPGAGTFNLTESGNGANGYTDIFITKSDASGNLIWAKQFGSNDPNFNSNDAGYSLIVDLAGNVYATGAFYATVDFNPGAATANLTSAGGTDIFVLKLDASGNYVWARAMGGPSSDAGSGIVVDNSGNVYTAGSFNTFLGNADFDPGAGTFMLAATGFDAFVSKLDASGNFVWAKNLQGSPEDFASSITLDVSGNVYTTGYFDGTGDFDPNAGTASLTASGYTDIFVWKLSNSGNYIWAKAVGGPGNSANESGYAIITDVSGNAFVTGNFSGTADFDPNAGTANLTAAGSTDIFVLKLDASGNHVWSRRMGGTGADAGLGIMLDLAGNVYTGGYFSGTADFDPGAGTADLTSAGNSDIYFNRLDASGNHTWAKRIGGTGQDAANEIVLDLNSNVYVTGFFNNTADFDPSTGTLNLTSAGSQDIFLAKFGASTLPIKLKDFKLVVNNGVTKLSWVTAQEQDGLYFEVEKSSNGVNFQPIAKLNSAGNSTYDKTYSHIDNLPAASSYYRLKLVDADGKYFYSNTLRAAVSTKQSITVFPNPVKSTFSLQINKPTGIFKVRIYNSVGQVLFSKTIDHLGGNATETIQLNKALPKGLYKLEVTSDMGDKQVINLVAE